MTFARRHDSKLAQIILLISPHSRDRVYETHLHGVTRFYISDGFVNAQYTNGRAVSHPSVSSQKQILQDLTEVCTRQHNE